MAGHAGRRVNPLTRHRVGSSRKCFKPQGAASIELRPNWNAGQKKLQIRRHQFHFFASKRQLLAVHAALHAAVDALLGDGDYVFAPAKLRETHKRTYPRISELAPARIDMA